MQPNTKKGLKAEAAAIVSFTMIFLTICGVVLVTGADCRADSFQAGSLGFSLVAGSGRAFNDNYVVLGLGAGYYLLNGLAIGLDAEAWLGGDPGIYKVSPQVKYVLQLQSNFRPYVGGFYRRTFIDGFDDQDSAGGRAGVYYTSSNNMYFGIGAVYESYFDCDDRLDNCDDIYPEFTLAFSF